MTTNKHGYPEPIVRETDDFICAAYLRIPDLNVYNGEYGFDWLEIEPKDGEVKEIQGVPFDKVTHCFMPSNENHGNVLKRESDEELKGKDIPKRVTVLEIQQKIKDTYPKFVNVEGRYIDVAQILLKKGQEIELDLHIKCLKGELDGSEIVEVISNDHYKFKLKEHKEFQGTLSIPLEKKEDIFKLIIRCDDYTLNKEGEHFLIYLRQKDKANIPIGGYVMMQNKTLILTFRVIALVSKDGNEKDKARKLFDDFNNNKVKEFLNNNSLNQAGYQVNIENEDAINDPNADLNEYLYAFDKQSWISKKYFHENQPYDIRYYKQNEDGSYVYENNKAVLVEETKYDNILDAKDLDSIAICAYRNKLQNSEIYKDYIGGLIILSEYRSKENGVSAFSKVKPLNHYYLFVYATNGNDVHTFAHEIGHMLGLPHSFADSEVISFFPFVNMEKSQYKANLQAIEYESGIKRICCRKDALRTALENYNKYKKVSKEKVHANNEVIPLINELMPSDYYEFEPGAEISFYMLRDDYVKIYENYFNYIEETIAPRKKHILYFDQGATQNKMDYTRSGGKFYTSFQIEIMRDDYGYY